MKKDAEKKKNGTEGSAETEYLLAVLKGFMHQYSPGVFTGSWCSLIKLAEKQAVTGMLGYLAEQFPDMIDMAGEEQENAIWRKYLKNQYLNTLVLYTQRAEWMNERMEQMNSLGINHMLLKGIVIRNYYPMIELRTFCDIDILIAPEDRNRCDAWMMKEGFRRKTDWEPVYSYYKGNEFYEIHTELIEKHLTEKTAYVRFTQEIWKHAVKKEHTHTWEMEKEYHLVYLLTHLAKHIEGTGAGIRMYLDLALMIEAEKAHLDWEKIRELCKQLGIVRFAWVVLTFLDRYLDVKLDEKVMTLLEQTTENSEKTAADTDDSIDDPIIDPMDGPEAALVAEKLLQYTFSGGSFGRITERSGIKLLPGAERLEKRYTYLHNRPWLLPLAWVHRIVKNSSRWRECIGELRAVIKLDQQKFKEWKTLEKQLGLS